MDATPAGKLAVALLLVLVNGWFVLAEFAFVRVRQTRLAELAEGGSRAARRAHGIAQRLDEYLSAVQLGITLASLALGWIGEAAFASLFGPLFERLPFSAAITHGLSITFAFIAITFLHVVLGEQVPKIMAIHRAEAFSLACAAPLHAFYVLTWPIIKVLKNSSNGLMRLVGFRPDAQAEAHSEEELRLVVAASHRHGILDDATRDLLDNVFEYSDRVAREVMTPRRDVVLLDVTKPVDESVRAALDSEYTRFPLYDPDTDRVLGFLHVRDLTTIALGKRKVESLREIARQPVVVPENVPIDRVRRQLQSKRTHFGVVVDEFGDFTGVITLENVLEELVGEIQDELDREPPKIVKRPDGSVEADGSLLLSLAEKKLGLALTVSEEIDGIDTLGGYVFTLLGRAPVVGDAVDLAEHRLEVLVVEDLRIRRVRIVRLHGGTATDPPVTS